MLKSFGRSMLFAVLFVQQAHTLIHHLRIFNDIRNVFKIETFGFKTGGKIDLTVSDFSFHFNKFDSTDPTQERLKAGFVLRKADSESSAQQDLEKIVERRECIFSNPKPGDVVLDLSDLSSWKKTRMQHEIAFDEEGLYSLIFMRCFPNGMHKVDFKMDAVFTNPGPDYLSAGDAPLPSMYFTFFILFSIPLALWVWLLQRSPATHGTVHRVHYVMLALIVLKVCSLLFEGVRYHYISVNGTSEGWSIVYYIFAFLKGVTLFAVILLIGSGWSLMKNYLNDKEKKIVFIVLVLQVLDNIAMIVIEETAPGSQGWLSWRDFLHLVDIICCCAILLPIVWSIRHLRQAAEVDGKAHNSLTKLTLFRQFYVMVIVYIYFTRIVVFLLAAAIPFNLIWLGPMATESATLIFYVVVGFKFRPAVDNPYLPVRREDMEGLEYGLEDDGLEQYGSKGVELLPPSSAPPQPPRAAISNSGKK